VRRVQGTSDFSQLALFDSKPHSLVRPPSLFNLMIQSPLSLSGSQRYSLGSRQRGQQTIGQTQRYGLRAPSLIPSDMAGTPCEAALSGRSKDALRIITMFR